MRKFEFMLKKIATQDRWRLFLSSVVFLIPSQIFRVFFAFVFFSRKLPREIERKDDEILLEFPLKRWEIFANDFLINSLVLVASGALSVALFKQRELELLKLFRTLLAFPYIYGLEVICAKYLKSNFLLPFIAFVVDLSFWGTDWGHISALSERSVFGTVISISVFLTAFFLYSLEDFGRDGFVRGERSV